MGNNMQYWWQKCDIDGGDIGGREGIIICNIGGRNVILMLVILVAEKRSAPHRELVTGEWGLLLLYEGGFFFNTAANIFPGLALQVLPIRGRNASNTRNTPC